MKENTFKKEKEILVTLIGTILVFSSYSLFVYKKFLMKDPGLLNDLQFWGKTFLMLIPVAIVALIIFHIIFAIINKVVTNEDIPMVNDERDKLIELKSIRVSHWVFTFGFFLAMGSLAIGMEIWVMFLVLISFGFLSGIISELVKLRLYRKGF